MSETKSLFEKYSTSSSSKENPTQVLQVEIDELSSVIDGEFGPFRVFKANGKKFTVDSRKVINHQVFKAKGKATLTLSEITTKAGDVKVVVNGLQFELPQASGYFVMQ